MSCFHTHTPSSPTRTSRFLRRIIAQLLSRSSSASSPAHFQPIEPLESRRLLSASPFDNSLLDNTWHLFTDDASGSITFNANLASITSGSITDSNGTESIIGDQFNIFSNGSVDLDIQLESDDESDDDPDSFHGHLNSSFDLLATTASSLDPNDDSTDLTILLAPNPNPFTLQDLTTGTWFFSSNISRGTLLFNPNNSSLSGSFYANSNTTASFLNSSSYSFNTSSGQIDASLFIPNQIDPISFSGFLAPSKGVFVASGDLDGDGKSEILVATRPNSTPNHSNSNLSGELSLQGSTFRGSIILDGKGKILGGSIDTPSQSNLTPSGSYKVSPNGSTTFSVIIDLDNSGPNPPTTFNYSGAINSSFNTGAFALTKAPTSGDDDLNMFLLIDPFPQEPVISVSSKGPASENGTNLGKSPGFFTFTRTGPTSQSLTFPFNISGSASPGVDIDLFRFNTPNPSPSSFIPISPLANTLTFNTGQSSFSVRVVPFDDTDSQGTRSFSFEIPPASDGLFTPHPSDDSASLFIFDNDKPLITVVAQSDAAEQNTEHGTFTIHRSGLPNGPLTITLNLAGTATPNDYQLQIDDNVQPPFLLNPKLKTVTFPDGQSTITVHIIPTDDTLPESDEIVILSAKNSPLYRTNNNSSSSLSIADNDQRIAVSLSNDEITEGSPDPILFTFSSLFPAPTGGLKINFKNTGSAKPNSFLLKDLSNNSITNNSITIPQGLSSVQLNLFPVDNSLADHGRTICLNPIPNTNYSSDPDNTNTFLTILDNEPIVSTESLDNSASEQNQTTGLFRISRTGPTTLPLNVNILRSGSAVAADYSLRYNSNNNPIPGNIITIPAGQTSVDVKLLPTDDALTESTETATFTIKPTPAYSSDTDDNESSIQITDNEPVVSITKTKDTTEAASGPARGLFTISRTGSTFSSLVVNLNTPTGTATSGADYSALPSSIIIPKGKSSVTLDLSASSDSNIEGSETVILSLNSGSYTINNSQSSATLNIADGPINVASLFGNVTFTQTTIQDLTTNVPFFGKTGQITSTGNFTSTNGRTGSYSYNVWYGPGQTKRAELVMFYNGASPSLHVNPLSLFWTASRPDSLNGKTIQWPSSAPGSSGTFDTNGSLFYNGVLLDTTGFFKVS